MYEVGAREYSPQIQVTPATPSDLDAVMDLVRGCIARMRADAIDQWDEVYPSRRTFEEDLTAGTLWLAKDMRVCRGVMVLNERQAPEYNAVPWRYRGEPVLVVHRLAVDPAVQGQGIASRLMDFAEAYARAHGYCAIRLDAFRDNPRAIGLYIKRGYRLAGEVSFRKGVFSVFEKCLDGYPETLLGERDGA